MTTRRRRRRRRRKSTSSTATRRNVMSLGFDGEARGWREERTEKG